MIKSVSDVSGVLSQVIKVSHFQVLVEHLIVPPAHMYNTLALNYSRTSSGVATANHQPPFNPSSASSSLSSVIHSVCYGSHASDVIVPYCPLLLSAFYTADMFW